MRSLFLIVFLMLSFTCAHSAIVQVNGKWCDDRYAPQVSTADHFDLGKQLLTQEKWDEANKNFMVIAIHFKHSPLYAESLYHSGVCYFNLEDYDMANQQFSAYLNSTTSLQHFEKVFEYKYQIAEAFSGGARKHMFGSERLPKLLSSKKLAHEIFDEVIAALSNKELALKALYSKASLYFAQKEYEESVETLTTLVRRFPSHSLASDSYLLISQIYLEKGKLEPQNPDYISLAKVNFGKLVKNFPGDEENIAKAQANLEEMQEICAGKLFEMAQFYAKKKKPKASEVYYNEAIRRYPQTLGANKAREKIANEKHLVEN